MTKRKSIYQVTVAQGGLHNEYKDLRFSVRAESEQDAANLVMSYLEIVGPDDFDQETKFRFPYTAYSRMDIEVRNTRVLDYEEDWPIQGRKWKK